MKPSSWRVFVVAVVIALSSTPAAGAGGACSASVSPSPGWLGATITFSGAGLKPGAGYWISFHGQVIKSGTVASSPTLLAGRFSYSYTIPNQQVYEGNTSYLVTTNDGCQPMTSAAPYTVLYSAPVTTTTTAAVTTTTAVTTTAPVNTTAPVTTSAPVATTAAVTTVATTTATTGAADSEVLATTSLPPSSTTGAQVDSTSATTIAVALPATPSGGGTSPILLVLLAALVGSLVFVGIRLGGRRQ